MDQLYDRRTYFSYVRELGSTLTQDQVDGTEFILDAMEAGGYADHWQNAYVLATTYHEVAGTMRPIREYGRGRGRRYGRPLSKYGNQIAYGRGYVQLTWASNYERADRELGLNGRLVRNFDLALDPPIAAQIILRGMSAGWFTGRKLSNYIDMERNKRDYRQARRIVNGMDRADLIASYARKIEDCLVAAADPDLHVPPPMEEPQ